MDIKVVLAHLDPANDEHWTSDGVPRMDVVSEFAGRTVTRKELTDAAPDFTRESAQAAMDAAGEPEEPGTAETAEATEEGAADPDADDEQDETEEEAGLRRQAEANGPGPAPNPDPVVEPPAAPPESNDPVDPMQPDPDADDEQDDEAEEPPPVLSELGVLQAELAEATDRMYEAQRIMREAKITSDRSSDLVNSINVKISAIERRDPNHGTKAIRDYLTQQNKNRLKRAEGLQKFISQTGVSPTDVARAVNPKAPIDQAMVGRKPARGSVRPSRI